MPTKEELTAEVTALKENETYNLLEIANLKTELEELKKKKKGKLAEAPEEKADSTGYSDDVAELLKDKEELVEFLMKFRVRNKFQPALYLLANSKEFYWLLDKHSTREPIIDTPPEPEAEAAPELEEKKLN